ncbi:hypothetical protein LJC45_03520 [Alistipes sp. OttesenSCG-928-B03]|nr:hypothetical protein [Alistipes sp. OttesenSCG-928-B03]
MFTIKVKGRPDPKNKELAKLQLVFYRPDYARVSKEINITGLYKDWNQKDQCFNGRGTDVIATNKKLLDLRLKYSKVAEEWEEEEFEWSPVQLSHHFDKSKSRRLKQVKVLSVSQYLDHLIALKRESKRVKKDLEFSCSSTAATYLTLKNALAKFTQSKYEQSLSSFFFVDIDEQFLKDFVFYCESQGLKNGNKAGLEQKLKKFYGTFYFANKDGIPGADLEIFNCVEQKMKSEETMPQTLPYSTIQKIEKLDQSLFTKREVKHIKYFLFCFYCGGMAPIDAATVTTNCIVDGSYISYERNKFPKRGKPPINEKAWAIINDFKSESYGDYLLPIILAKHKTEKQMQNRMANLCVGVNATLEKVAKIIGVKKFTWYAARGTFISRMLDLGCTPVEVAEMAGNSPNTIYKYYYKNTKPEDMLDLANKGL